MTRRTSLGLLAGGILATTAQAGTTEAPLNEAAIAALLKDFVDVRKQSLGIAVGLMSPAGRFVIGHGKLAVADPRVPDADTVFDIASVTKTFTGLILAEAVRRGDVRYDDPLAKYLPAEVRVPTRGGRQITLIDLATHTSGLPFELQDANDPAFARAAEANPMGPVYDLLKTLELETDIGSRFAYSNLNYGLLGVALARQSGLTYGQLLARRVLRPLRMPSTGLDLTPAMSARRALPHTDALTPGPEWNKPWGGPAGGLKSTVRDLMAYLSAYAGLTPSPLAAAMAETRTHLRPAPDMGSESGIGWLIAPIGGAPVAWFGGIGPGFASGVAYDPAARTAVVVLSNARPQVADLALHILRPSRPLVAPPPVVAQDAALDPFVGRYRLARDLPQQRLAAGTVIEIKRGPNGLIVQIPGGPPGPLTRQSDSRFAIIGFPLSVTFNTAAAPVDALTLTIQGQSVEGMRVP